MYLDDVLEVLLAGFLSVAMLIGGAIMFWWMVTAGESISNQENKPNLSTLSGQVIKTKMVDAYDSDAEYKITVKPENGNSTSFKLDPTVNSYVKKGDTVKIVKNADDEVQSIQKINE